MRGGRVVALPSPHHRRLSARARLCRDAHHGTGTIRTGKSHTGRAMSAGRDGTLRGSRGFVRARLGPVSGPALLLLSGGPASRRTLCLPDPPLSPQRPGKAQLVPVRTGDVEIPLSPGRITRREIGVPAGIGELCVQGVEIGVVEDQPTPPAPTSLGW